MNGKKLRTYVKIFQGRYYNQTGPSNSHNSSAFSPLFFMYLLKSDYTQILSKKPSFLFFLYFFDNKQGVN